MGDTERGERILPDAPLFLVLVILAISILQQKKDRSPCFPVNFETEKNRAGRRENEKKKNWSIRKESKSVEGRGRIFLKEENKSKNSEQR